MYNSKFWNTFFENVNDLFKEFDSAINDNYEDEDSVEKSCKENGSNYYHFVSDKYENGKHVDHKEKIVDNGKVIMDEHNSIEDKKEEKRTIGSEVIKAKNSEIEKLKAENEKLRKENENLKLKIAQIKNMFN